MAVLVRTWNVFHGNADPPERRAYLEEMVRLATADRPGVACLQELPVWALSHLAEWSGMTAVGAVASRPLLGSARLGRVLTELHHGLLRSAFTGQALATLVSPRMRVLEERSVVVSDRGEGERRICQTLRVAGLGVVANVHVTSDHAGDQLRRAVDLVLEQEPPTILCGDFNLVPGGGGIYERLRAAGFSEPAPGIDQVLVRGAPSTVPFVWPGDRRVVNGRRLSDHAPVELQVG